MGQSWETRRTLLQRAKDGSDHDAWDEFVLYYEPFIQRVIRQASIESIDTQDIVQETLLALWKGLSDFEIRPQTGGFRAWLSKLIRNRIIDHVRKNNSRELRCEVAVDKGVFDKDCSENDVELVIEKEWERYITQTALQNIRDNFSAKAVLAFELSLKGKSADEISRELSIKQDSVRTLKNRVKNRVITEVKRLRSELEF